MGSSGSLVWLAVIPVAFALFWAPVIVAAARGTQQMGLVVLLTLLTLAVGVTWFAAWVAVIILPTRGQSGPAGRVPAAYPWTGASRPGAGRPLHGR